MGEALGMVETKGLVAMIEAAEAAKKQAFATTDPNPLWSGAFQRPTDTETSGVFGTARVVNGVQKAQHKGLDIKTKADFCRHPRIIDLLQRQVDTLTADLSRFERVKRVALLERELTTEGGELTPTLKIKRRIIDAKYKDVIDRIYEDAEKP